MTLGMLKDCIQALVDEAEAMGLDPDELETAIAYQPSWPLVAQIVNLRIIQPDPDDLPPGQGNAVAWIATSQTEIHGSPYAPKAAWECE